MNDVEIKEAVTFVKERVSRIQEQEREEERLAHAHEEKEHNDDDSNEYEEREDEHGVKTLVRKVKTRKAAQPNFFTQDDDTHAHSSSHTQSSSTAASVTQRAVIDSIINSNTNMRNIHSSASVRAMMKNNNTKKSTLHSVGEDDDDSERTRFPSLSSHNTYAYTEPKIATHDRDSVSSNGTQKKEIDVQNLPFLYRHPGI